MNDMAARIKAETNIQTVLEENGVRLIGNGPEKKAKCPFHEDGNPSFGVNVETGLWHCHACKVGGDVISLLAKFAGKDASQYLREAAESQNDLKTPWRAVSAPKKGNPVNQKIVKIYPYHDSLGREVYQVVRLEPKSFRQRHPGENGDWVWNMDRVQRVLYRLPDIIQAQEVWVVEGEKDADTLVDLGFCATCNVGGAGKWLDSYTESLADKDVVLCGDNDKPGEEHVNKVMDSLAGKVKSLRRVRLPLDFKDASDYAASFGPEKAQATDAFCRLRDESKLLLKGIDLPLRSMAEMEADYADYVQKSNESPLDLGRWLPSLRKCCRKMVPGDLVTVLGGTGVGKTTVLQNICGAFPDIPMLFFQLELSPAAMFERMLVWKTKWTGEKVEEGYAKGSKIGKETLDKMFSKLLICNESGLTIEKISQYVKRAELKLGEPPRLVLIDYIQLMEGKGDSRYERFSQIAEDARKMANALNLVVVMTSQIKRKNEEGSPEVSKTDAKESGSIENSSSLLLGAWRVAQEEGDDRFFVKVIKNSRGASGLVVECNWDKMRIVETSRIEEG